MSVSEIRFADGFDEPDSVAFGLGAPQLLAVVAGLLLGYALLSSPIGLAISAPPALLAMAAGASAAWVRVDGRPGIEWAWLAARHLVRPKSGTFTWDPGAPEPAGVAPTAVVAGPRPASPRWITFFSLNGGSGRTTLASEVACCLAARMRRGEPGDPAQRLKVALVDANPLNADVATVLGIPHPTPLEYAAATRPQAVHASGVVTLPGSPRALPTPSQPAEQERVAAAAQRLQREGTDVIVFDIGSELGPIAGWVLSAVTLIYVVITPTARGILDAYRSTATLRRMGCRHKLAYVLNQSDGTVDLAETMGDLRGRMAAIIPSDHRRGGPRPSDADDPFAAAIAALAADACSAEPADPQLQR